MNDAFDTFCRDLAADPTCAIDSTVVKAWLASRLKEDGAEWVLSEITDEFCQMHPDGGNDLKARIALDALTMDNPQAVVWYALSDALRSVVRKYAEHRANAYRVVDDLFAPLKAACDHYDAIQADRRALAKRQP